jgi:7-keto-8-aminopelargonate synthetase-like enzyme
VPEGTARIKVSLNCHHEEHEMTDILDCLAEVSDVP